MNAAQPLAFGACSVGRVERKRGRHRVAVGDARIGTHQVAAVIFHLIAVHGFHHHDAFPGFHGSRHRCLQTMQIDIVDDQFIDHDFDIVGFIAVHSHPDLDFGEGAIHAGSEESLLQKAFKKFLVMSLAPLDYRRQQQDAPPLEILQNQLNDFLVGVFHHPGAGRIGIRLSRPSIEQTQIIVNLRDGTHRRTRILAGGFLVKGNHRAETRDFIHVRTFHLSHKLPGVRQQSLHIPPLSLGINRVECQGRFSAATQTGNHRQAVARYSQIDIFKIVFTGAVNGNHPVFFLYIPHILPSKSKGKNRKK